MKLEHLKEGCDQLYRNVLVPTGAKLKEWGDLGLAKAKEWGDLGLEKTKDAAIKVKDNAFTAHTRDKALEVAERTFDSFVLGTVVIVEAVFGLREKGVKYESPWKTFTWTGPAELMYFTPLETEAPKEAPKDIQEREAPKDEPHV